MASVSQFAGNALLAQGGGFEPQRASNFAIHLYGIGDMDTLILSLRSSDIPGVSFEEGTVKYFNQTVKYAAAVTPFANQTIVFNDFVDRNTFAALAAWQNLVWSPASGGIGYASQYKKSGEIFLLPPGTPSGGAVSSGQALNNRVYKLQGIWPKELKHDRLDMEDAGTKPLAINLTLSIDVCTPASMV